MSFLISNLFLSDLTCVFYALLSDSSGIRSKVYVSFMTPEKQGTSLSMTTPIDIAYCTIFYKCISFVLLIFSAYISLRAESSFLFFKSRIQQQMRSAIIITIKTKAMMK